MVKIKILGSVWFDAVGKRFGIVVINNGDEEKAYLGVAGGYDKQVDEDQIVKWGAKFPVKQAKELI